jgi:iron complex transport system permease protein
VTRPVCVLMLLALALVCLQIVSLGIGPTPVSLADLFADWTGSRDLTASERVILWDLRWPRILLAGFVGSALGAAGAGYQGLFRNPLADPFVIGASSGAALGVAVAVVLGIQFSVLGVGINSVAALCGSLGAVSLVYSIASLGRQVPVLSLLLAGVAVSSFAGALVSLLMFLNDKELVAIFHWILGSLAGQGWSAIYSSVPLMMFGLAGLWMFSRALDALTFGDDAAQALGLNLLRSRTGIVLAASLTTAAAVSSAGTIGFIGLISPHAARFLVGARHALVIPASALVGAILLVIADGLARTLAAPAELPVGVVTALLGSPFFLILLKTRQRELGAAS